MVDGDSSRINIGVSANSYDNTEGARVIKTGDFMIRGNSANLNVGLQNLDFFPSSFFSNVGGSHITQVGNIMNDGDLARINVGVSAQNYDNTNGQRIVRTGDIMLRGNSANVNIGLL